MAIAPMGAARAAAIKARLDLIPDDDLPPPARRSRVEQMRDSRGTVLVAGDAVDFPEGTGTVIGLGRGVAWFMVGHDEDGTDVYGTYHSRMVTKA